MTVFCKRIGGYGLKIENPKGNFRRIKLVYGENDVDPALIQGAIDRLPEKMRAAVAADIDLDGSSPEVAAAPEKMTAAEKVELVKAADSLAALRDLAEGEERKTVTAAIDRRAAELEADDEDE